MKTRNGFVSNSSSSSFIIKKKDLTPVQVDSIVNYQTVAKIIGKYGEPTGDLSKDEGMFGWIDDFWVIENGLFKIKGYTTIDNFNMHKFLEVIGVSSDKIEWREF